MLGEQSAKQLRGARMDEVIFAGNNHRRPLGMAEVTLTFDNADSVLPSPFAEIAVTRRVYRTGESEYFLNRTQVRLRDIMDLLLGTGLGPDASAIISQGQIDAILSAKPGERREIFEEAAGTSKYQARKREAQRRLEQTETNALRVNDVLVEIEQQVPALESQVRRAKRYRKATHTLRDLEILSFVRKTVARREERKLLADVLASDETVRAGTDAQREHLTAEANTARYDEYQSTVALDERTAARSETAALASQAATAHATAQARSEDAERRCLDHARDVKGAEMAVDDARTRIDTLVRELAASRERRDEALAAAERAANEEREGSRAWETAYTALRSVEDRRASAAADAAQSDTASQAAAAQNDRIVEHEHRLSAELDGVAKKIEAERARESEVLEQSDGHDVALARLVRESESAVAQRDAKNADVENARTSANAARSRALETNARLDALKQFDDAGLGMPSAVRTISAHGKEAGLRGVIGVVADLIEVEGAYATAIDVALGSRIHDVVTESAADARAAIDMLKRKRAGRATFLPLELVRQQKLPLVPDAAGTDGYVGRATELVRCNADNVRGAVDHLLADVIVVASLPAALKLSSTHANATIVTLDGEIVRGASITGGSGEGDTGPLARRAQIAELRRDLERATSIVAEAETAFDAARAALDVATADVERIALERVDAQLKRRDADSALERIRAELGSLLERHAALTTEIARATSDLEKAQADARRYAQRASAARAAVQTLETERNDAARDADRLQATLSDLRDRHRSAAAEAAALVERVAQAGDDVEAARADHVASQRTLEGKSAELDAARAERDAIRSEAAALARRKSEAEGRMVEVEAQVEELRGKRDELGARARQVEEALAAVQQQERERSMDAQAHKIRVAEIDAELSLLQETFAQNPATEEECDAVAGRYATFEGEADAEIRRLRDEVGRLGNVNLNALEDQAALLERREFLRQQLADLEGARNSILSVIAEIDAESLRQFNATFGQIAQAFSETFARLFTGGIGKIWLAEAEDPTEAGIEIAVQPPGKKMQSLNLLSGGERAMTAVALIFAILQVRPSPFYIFDEIDAALDEANIGRFGSLLREIADRAQTVIITHNKATMTLADRIYGVTMGEPGVSNILSLALEQVSA